FIVSVTKSNSLSINPYALTKRGASRVSVSQFSLGSFLHVIKSRGNKNMSRYFFNRLFFYKLNIFAPVVYFFLIPNFGKKDSFLVFRVHVFCPVASSCGLGYLLSALLFSFSAGKI